MSFVITVKASTRAAQAGIGGLKKGLEDVEQRSGRARDAMGRFTSSGAKGLDGMKGAADRLGGSSSWSKLQASFGGLQKQISGLTSGFTAMQALGGLAALGLLRSAASIADSYTNLSNRLRAVSTDQSELNGLMDATRRIATATRTEWTSTGEAFVRLRLATKDLGISQAETLRLTESINKAIVLSGASSSEATNGLMQLSQGLASGALRGDELRSVMENLPGVADVLAKGLGKTRGELRQMGEEGKITTAVMVESFRKAGPELDRAFGKTVPTLGQLWTKVQNDVTLAVGKFAEASGITKVLGAAIDSLSQTFGVLSAVAGGVIGPLVAMNEQLEKATGIDLGGALTTNLASLIGGAANSGLQSISDSMNASTIAATEASQAYLNQIEFLKQLGTEELKIEKTAQVMNAAIAAGVQGLPSFDQAIAKSAAELRLAHQKIGIDISKSFTEAEIKANQLTEAVGKLKEKDAAAKLAKDVALVYKHMQGINDVIKGQNDHWGELTAKVKEYQDAFKKGVVRWNGPTPSFRLITRDDVDIARGLRDETLQLDNVHEKYGKTVVDARMKTLQHADALADLKGAYKAGQLSQKEFADGLRELGVEEGAATKLLKTLTDPLRQYSDNMGALALLYQTNKISAAMFNAELIKLMGTMKEYQALETPKFDVGPRKIGGVGVNVGFDAKPSAIEGLPKTVGVGNYWTPTHYAVTGNEIGQNVTEGTIAQASTLEQMGIGQSIDTKWMDDLSEKQRGIEAAMLRNTKATALWNAELERLRSLSVVGETNRGFADGLNQISQGLDVATQAAATLANAFKGIEDAFVSFVTTGKISFKSLVESMLSDLARLAFKQAMSGLLSAITGGPVGLGGEIGAPQGFMGGHATGGSWMVRGSGGTDSVPVSFMASPGERVTVATQSEQARRGRTQALAVRSNRSTSRWSRVRTKSSSRSSF